MIKQLFLLISVYGIGVLALKAQQPAHFVVGTNELAQVSVYDIIQDAQYNYWLATDKGIIKYNGQTFTEVNNDQMLVTSVFGWTKDSQGDVYCYNLSGQIFKIEKSKSRLYYQVPDSLMSNELYFQFDEQDRLVIASSSLFRVDGDRIEVLYKQQSENNIFSSLFKKRDGSLITHAYLDRKIIEIINGELKVANHKIEGNQLVVFQFMYLNDSLHAFNKHTTQLITIDKDNNVSLEPLLINVNAANVRYYADQQNLILATSVGGIYMFDNDLAPLYGGSLMYKKQLISKAIKDHEGNWVLGTFKSGLIVIPNTEIVDIGQDYNFANFTNIVTHQSDLYIGTQEGAVLKLNSEYQFTTLRKKQMKSIEGLAFIKNTNELLIDEIQCVLLDLNTGKEKKIPLGALKDIADVHDQAYFIATSSSLYLYNPDLISLPGIQLDSWTKDDQLSVVHGFAGRNNCVNYDTKNHALYVGTYQGLKIAQGKSIKNYKINNHSIIASDILYHDGRMYVATQQQGLLVFDNNQLLKQWTIADGLFSNTINQIRADENRLYIASADGFQIINTNGDILHGLKKSDGLLNVGIQDFEIAEGILLIMQQDRIQRMNLNSLPKQPNVPSLHRKYVIHGNDTLQAGPTPRLNYTQGKFELAVECVALRYQDEIQYHYQLSGINTDWQTNSYYNSTIRYLALPPGNYTFSIKAVLRNQESETLQYQFVILPPYWTTWWFYVLVVLLVLALSSSVFFTIYLRQRRKIALQNELNNAKLSAIQSQMNPHFIFNALNSIQEFIVLNNKKMASFYLGKFADLMRIYLNHSQLKTVTLQEEIEALTLYLELEKLRFDTLEAQIEVDDALNPSIVLIPTLLIQPYVENALKHGLLHQRDDKRLKIEFKFLKEVDLIECIITDNGIGRAASAEVNKMRNPLHQSFATKATKNRLDLLNYGHYKPIGEEVIDLTDENELPCGTKVILRIPMMD